MRYAPCTSTPKIKKKICVIQCFTSAMMTLLNNVQNKSVQGYFADAIHVKAREYIYCAI